MTKQLVEPTCVTRGCGHALNRHKLEEIRVWTAYDDYGEIEQSHMGYKMICYDVCEDTETPHQCHCKRFESGLTPPNPNQLLERP